MHIIVFLYNSQEIISYTTTKERESKQEIISYTPTTEEHSKKVHIICLTKDKRNHH